jgi:hypothetical protein
MCGSDAVPIIRQMTSAMKFRRLRLDSASSRPLCAAVCGSGGDDFAAAAGREQQRDQHVAAGPAHDEGEALETREVQRARHADERGGAHPVRPGGHAVEDGRHAPARHVVFGDIRGAAHHADAGIERHSRKQEDIADHLLRHAELLGHRQADHEQHEAARVPRVIAAQAAFEIAYWGQEVSPLRWRLRLPGIRLRSRGPRGTSGTRTIPPDT